MGRYVVLGLGVVAYAWAALEATIFAVLLAPNFIWLFVLYVIVPSAVFWILYTLHEDQVKRTMDASEDGRVPPKLFAFPFSAFIVAFALSQVNGTRWFD